MRNLLPTAVEIAETQLCTAEAYQPLRVLLLAEYIVEAEGRVLLLSISDLTKLVVSNLFGVGKQLTVWTKQEQRIVLCRTRNRKGEEALLEFSRKLCEKNPELEAELPAESLPEEEEEAFAEIKC